jgi:hypothetical protein
MNKPIKRLIRSWMAANEHTPKSIAESFGSSATAVRRFILGTMTSKPMAQWFLEKGCPSSSLGLKEGIKR